MGLWFHSENVSVACGHVWCDHGCDRWDVMLIATMVPAAMAAMATCFVYRNISISTELAKLERRFCTGHRFEV